MKAGRLAKPPHEKPFPKCLPLRSFDGKVDRDTEERISESVVRRGFSGDDPSQINRHVLMCVLSTYVPKHTPFHQRSSTPGTAWNSPMIAAEITGSVGVRQADMAKQEIKLSDGKSSNMNPRRIRSAKRP